MSFPVLAADSGRLEEIRTDSEITGLTWRENGTWRTRVQLVFDPTTRTLLRRRYTLWDPRPSLQRTFTWEPEDAASAFPGRITGRGRIAWRDKGRPSYDQAAISAEYAGEVRDGRISGHGTLKTRSGYYYTGAFRDGLMHGRGQIQLPGGDHYSGDFVESKAHGTGRYIDVTGEIYDGPFVRGRRHGTAKTTLPDGRTYHSQWRRGIEVPASRRIRFAQRGNSSYSSSRDDVRIGIIVDQRLPTLSKNKREPLGENHLRYRASNIGRQIHITPDSHRLMQMWKGTGPINLKPFEERNSASREDGIFSFTTAQLAPLSLNIQIQNRSSRRVRITGAYVDVSRSLEDRKPAVQISVGSYGECIGLPGGYFRPSFYVENFGWSAAKKAVLSYRIKGAGPDLRQKSIGSVSRRTKVSFIDELRSLAVRIKELRRASEQGFACRKNEDYSACVARVSRSGVFGNFPARDGPSDGPVIALAVEGKLSYSWQDKAGSSRQEARPFKAVMPLAYLRSGSECGEGGSPQAITTRTQQLRLNATNYRLPISLRSSIPAGRTVRLFLPITAPRSSQHDFHVVVALSDGRRVRSRPIRLVYFKPSWLPEDLPDPEPESASTRRDYNQFDLIGPDLRSIRNVGYGRCSSACEKTFSCAAFTYDDWNRWCYLKSAVRKARFDPKYTSRILRGRVLPAKDRRLTKILRYRGKVFPTDQNFAFEIREASGFQECERYCAAKRLCVAFSYFRRSSQCHFYEHVGAYVAGAGVDSGIKRVQP